MTDDEKAQHESEYKTLLALFVAMLKNINNESKEEALFALAELRAELAINHALKGLDLDIDEALRLLKNMDDTNLTQHEKDLRDRIVAAVNNLIDFAVCEEYQLYQEVLESVDDSEIDFNSEEYEELEALCEKYNDTYAAIENSDIEYALAVAARWIGMGSRDYVVYWTQNDAKVRPWHMELQGYAAPRDEFPSWMIPPIEWNCRCFLEVLDVRAHNTGIKNVKGAASKIEKPSQLNDVFSESVATCGRIFGPSHSYFQVKEEDKEMLQGFVSRIKQQYYG